jgi:CxxC-x17-CxxC domain-containing protein
MEEFKDQWLVCVDCQEMFLWDAGEQHWYRLMNLSNSPRRCKKCRDKRRSDKKDQPHETTAMRCQQCGKPTQVPFAPQGTKPVYCRRCMSSMNVSV